MNAETLGVREVCIKAINEVLGVDKSTPVLGDAIELNQLSLDSLDMLEVVSALELYYDITIESYLVRSALSLDQLVAVVESKLGYEHNVTSEIQFS